MTSRNIRSKLHIALIYSGKYIAFGVAGHAELAALNPLGALDAKIYGEKKDDISIGHMKQSEVLVYRRQAFEPRRRKLRGKRDA